LASISTTKEKTVRVGPMVNIAGLLQTLGFDPEPVFNDAGLAPDDFIDTERRVSYAKCGRLLAACAATTGCEHFGLLLGQMAGPSHLGIPGFLATTAATVGDALKSLVKNLDLHDEGGSCDLLNDGDYCRLSYTVHHPDIAGLAQIHDFTATIMYQTMRLICGRDWNPTQVLMVRSRPLEARPWSRCFRTAVLFDSEVCGVVFPSQNLALSPPSADRLLFHHLELEAEMLHQVQNCDIRQALPVILQRGLLNNRYSAVDIADALQIRERTLHRRLKSLGTNYRYELDAARESLSKQLLESSSRPIHDIAATVGYSGASCFVRAFHRWAGVTPAAWREKAGRRLPAE
jgi:AraC-like DNA-binding protein